MARKAIRGGNVPVVQDSRRERRRRDPSNTALAPIEVHAMDQVFNREEGDYTVTTNDGQTIPGKDRPQNHDAKVTSAAAASTRTATPGSACRPALRRTSS